MPRDLAVIGFDDVDEGRYSLPSLTTVDPGRAKIARIAVDLLIERIGGVFLADQPARELRAGFRIVDRESTAIAR